MKHAAKPQFMDDQFMKEIETWLDRLRHVGGPTLAPSPIPGADEYVPSFVSSNSQTEIDNREHIDDGQLERHSQ